MLNNLENLVSLNPSGIPDALRAHDNWVAWIAVPNQKTGGYSKPPLSIRSGRRASPTNPADWASCDAALAFYKTHRAEMLAGGTVCGLGIALTESMGIVAVDLDGCVQDGKLSSEAAKIVASLGGLAELSPSGTGVHVFLRAALPPDAPKRRGDIEIYNDRRYLTVTGRWVGRPEGFAPTDLPSGPDIQAALDALIASMREPHGEKRQERQSTEKREKKTPAAGEMETSPSGPDMREPHGGERQSTEKENLIERLRGNPKFVALFDRGDTTAYHDDDSAADLALCNILAWAGCDAATIDTIFRQSRLMRPKWDEGRGGKTYGEMTIAKAIDGVAAKGVEGVAAKAVDPIVDEKISTACSLVLLAKTPRGIKAGLASAAKKLQGLGLIGKDHITTEHVVGKLLQAAIDAGLGEEKALPIISNILDNPEKKTEKKKAPEKPAPAPALPLPPDTFGLGLAAEPDPAAALDKAAKYIAENSNETAICQMAQILKSRGDIPGDTILRELRAALKTAGVDLQTGVPAIGAGLDAATVPAAAPIPEELRDELENVSYLVRTIRPQTLVEDIVRYVVTLLEHTPAAVAYPDHIAGCVTDGLVKNQHVDGVGAKSRAAIARACTAAAVGAMTRPVIDVPAEFKDFLTNLPTEADYALCKSNFFNELRACRSKLSANYVLCRCRCRMDGSTEIRAMSLRDWVRCQMYHYIYVVEGEDSEGQWYTIDGDRHWIRVADAMVLDTVCDYLGQLEASRVSSAKYATSVMMAVRHIARRTETMAAHGVAVRVACENGIVEMDEEWRPRRRQIELSDHITTRVHARWREDDDAELADAKVRMQAILRSFFLGDADAEEKITALLEAVGSAMLQRASGICWTFVGAGGNGKGVIQRMITRLVGEESCVHANSARFSDRLFLADMKDRSVVFCNESRVSDRLDTRAFNAVVTGDAVAGRHNYKENVYYTPYATVVIFSNHLPMFNDDSDGPMRRFLVVTLNRQFVRGDGSRDEGYSGDIDAELEQPIMMDALFRMAYDAVCAAAQRGWTWTRPASSVGENVKMREATSPLRTFVSDRLIPDPAGFIPSWSVYAQYAAWCRDSGIASREQLPYGQFYAELEMNVRVPVEYGTHNKKRYVTGYRLQPVMGERTDRQDKTDIDTALAALRMGLDKIVHAMNMNVSPQVKNRAIKAACNIWQSSIIESIEDDKHTPKPDEIKMMVRDHILMYYPCCMGDVLTNLEREMFHGETREKREARYVALVAQDGLWLASLPDDACSRRVCVAAVEQNPAALEYVRTDAETPEEYLAYAR